MLPPAGEPLPSWQHIRFRCPHAKHDIATCITCVCCRHFRVHNSLPDGMKRKYVGGCSSNAPAHHISAVAERIVEPLYNSRSSQVLRSNMRSMGSLSGIYQLTVGMTMSAFCLSPFLPGRDQRLGILEARLYGSRRPGMHLRMAFIY
jgi:hypothetical protein